MRSALSPFSCIVALMLSGVLLIAPLHAQSPDDSAPRPIPYPVTPSQAFMDAVEKETRTLTGEPGERYWTNTATYDIDATLDPETATLTGTASIQYEHNAPSELSQLVLHLRQNLHEEGAIRNREVQVTGGMAVSHVVLNGDTLTKGVEARPRYTIDGTRLYIDLAEPLSAWADAPRIDIGWSFEVPRGSEAPRMGREDDRTVFYLGYWYPQMAVYDDLEGWVAERYQGDGEFYMGFADYNVSLTVPDDWLVAATGTLQNADEVLAPNVRARLDTLLDARDIVSVVEADERAEATASSDTGTHTWQFEAERSRDFAWGTSPDYVWDATTASTGEGETEIHALYRPGTATWSRAAEYAGFSVEHLSDMLLPYPYPHMTVVEGVIGGGMEYPMITLIGGNRTPESLFRVVYHEISHMWFPMLVSSNEKRYTWMDEGTTSFNTNEGMADFYDINAWAPGRQYYYGLAGTDAEVPTMRHGDEYPVDGNARVVASYNKPGVMLHALRAILGDDTFNEAYRTYAEQWKYKHPSPYDLFHTFETVSDKDLDWFWRGAFYETWALDHAIDTVEVHDGQTHITVRDKGNLSMPVFLEVEFADGTTHTKRAEADRWLDGKTRTVTLTVDGTEPIRVQLDPEQVLPDTDRQNHLWMAPVE